MRLYARFNKDPIGEKAVKLQKEAVTPPFLYAVFPLIYDDAEMFVNDGICGKLRAVSCAC